MTAAEAQRKFSKLNEIVSKHGRKATNLVAILQDVQAEYRYLPEEVLAYVATALRIPPSVVFGVATFYSQFSLSPKGKYVIKVCDGTACHVRGSDHVCYAIKQAAGLKDDEITTQDLKLTVEPVACLGACGLAPAVMVNDVEVHGQMTPEEGKKLVESLLKREDGPQEQSTEGPSSQPVTFKISRKGDLVASAEKAESAMRSEKARILVCAETACVANGSLKVYEEIRRIVASRGLLADVSLVTEGPRAAGKVGVVKAGCHGYCQIGPLVKIEPGSVMYIKVKPEDAEDIVGKTIEKNEIVERLLYKDPATGKVARSESEIPFYSGQKKIVLRTCGLIDSEDIEEYIAIGGYQGLAKALTEMMPERVIEEVTASGLRGRGGGGFPTGKKWQFARQSKGDKKYVVCNADEGDPGAFMDRSVLEGDPHRVLEGMMIAGYAVGADEGYIYCRAEYPLAVKRFRKAIADAEGSGLLGDNILGTGFSFRVTLKEGAGAFVCGEETALLQSIEGKRGMPRPRPPFPAVSGLWGKPTLINNVETYANVPYIIANGAKAYNKYGTAKSAGTKTFSLAGQVARTGLIEVPMGMTLREVVFGIGGGMRRERPFKAVQIGGPSGGCLTKDHLDLPLEYEALTSVGAMVGSGGLVVVDDGTCMVEMAKFFMGFVQSESCGKCVPCREGTKRMLDLLKKITEGKATEQDVDLLYETAMNVKNSALCGLGKTAPNPVLTTMKYFRDEYMAHVRERRCPAGVCKALVKYGIEASRCKGCGVCAKACPAGAISGEIKKPYVIDQDACTKCGTCVEKCKFGAIGVS
ncbi:MAG: 4Fe-4S binding protein [Firmicutes bacterium]|nr:4Fe-4S binding protein [Bacillota bacterium]